MHIIYTFLCVALSCWYIYYVFIYIYIIYIYYIYTCTLYSPVKILTRVKCQAVKPLRESFRMFPACISCTNDLPGLPLLKLSNLSIFPRRMGVPQDSFIACAASRNLPYHAWAQPWGLCYRWCEVLRVQNLHLRCQNVSFVVHIFLHSHLGCWDSNSSWLAYFWTLRLETSNPVKLRRCHWLIGHHWSHKIWHSYTLWIPWMNFEWYIYIYHDHHQIPWNGIYRDLPYFFHTIGVAYGVRPGWPLVRGLAAATGRERWGEEPQTHVNPKWRQTNFVLIFLEWDVNYIYIYIYMII